MVHYEGVFIIDADASADVSKGVVAQLQDFVAKTGGRVDGLQEWGKKRLAYKINKKNDGNYVLLNYQMDSAHAGKFEQMIRLNDNVIRFLIINKDND